MKKGFQDRRKEGKFLLFSLLTRRRTTKGYIRQSEDGYWIWLLLVHVNTFYLNRQQRIPFCATKYLKRNRKVLCVIMITTNYFSSSFSLSSYKKHFSSALIAGNYTKLFIYILTDKAAKFITIFFGGAEMWFSYIKILFVLD